MMSRNMKERGGAASGSSPAEPGEPAWSGADYRYRAVDGGIEAWNGTRRFNRPLYSTVPRPDRQITLVSDRPEFMLMKISATKDMLKLANVMLGCAGGPWLSEVEPVLARHCLGLQQYRLGEGPAAVKIDAVRAMAFEGLLLRIRFEGEPPAPLVLAVGGRAHANYDQNPQASAFHPQECEGAQVSFAANVATLSGEGPPLHVAATLPAEFVAADADAVAGGPGALLESRGTARPVAAFSLRLQGGSDLFVVVTTDEPAAEGVRAFLTRPAEVFSQAIADHRAIADSIVIDTPDPYLNAALPHALLGLNAAWNAPTFRHGAIAWHDAYAGWRKTYGATTAGWHDRVREDARAFFAKQSPQGRIPGYLPWDVLYNMNEVLVDQVLYDWEWTGDLDFMRDGGFDTIARHLDWGETYLKTIDGLYENFLNAWNTDYKWCNGGGGMIASVYYWRANKAMADIAVRLGRDPAVFRAREAAIADAIERSLWSESAGVYGEYRDSLGLRRLHESPDLSSIYTPIDLRYSNPFRSYRMLRFALRKFEIPSGAMPRAGAIMYSSEWLPDLYSTRGLYTAEIVNTLLACYRIGQTEAAEPFRRAIDGSFFAGPAPGATGYKINPDGTFTPHTDFSDLTSIYVRTVVDGLFGVHMQASDERVTLQPAFPREWASASIRCKAVEYQYTWDGERERMRIATVRPLAHAVRLRARTAEIRSVTVNGRPVDHSVEPGIGCAWIQVEGPRGTHCVVEIAYGPEPLPEASIPADGEAGSEFKITLDRGAVLGVRDSGRALGTPALSASGSTCSVRLPDRTSVYTFFVLVSHRSVRFWLPVEVDVRSAVGRAARPDRQSTIRRPTYTPVDLSAFRNQRLEHLHENVYTPQLKPFYWHRAEWQVRTVQANGRSRWEVHQVGRLTPDVSRLTAAGGRFVTDTGVPVDVPASGLDAVFTSLYDQFPTCVDIPVALRGCRIYFLVVASTNPAQSRIENARLTVLLADGGRRELALSNPETIDDWLCNGTGAPYVQSGRAQALGDRGTHAVLQELDLGMEVEIQSVRFETLANEVLTGLLGITIVQDMGTP